VNAADDLVGHRIGHRAIARQQGHAALARGQQYATQSVAGEFRAPAHRFVMTDGPEGGIAILAPGFFEYEAEPDSVHVTLLRAVGRLSRDDLPTRTGHAGWPTPVTVSLAYDGDRALVTHGEPVPVTADELIGAPPESRAAIVHLGPEPTAWIPQAHRAGTLVFAEVGWDPSQQWSGAMLDQLSHCYAFLPNAEEAMAYTRTSTPRAAVAKLADLVPLAVVTCGRDGAIAIDSGTGEEAWAPALAVDAVDTTGAGDIFGASLVAGTLAGWPLTDRLHFANLCAGLSVQKVGGAPAAPGWPGIARWWHSTHDAQLRNDYAFLDQVME